MLKGEYILILGILFDLITTYTGTTYFNLVEGNVLGLRYVYIMSFITIFLAIISLNLKRPKYVDIILYLLGFFRFIVGVHNLVLIWN